LGRGHHRDSFGATARACSTIVAEGSPVGGWIRKRRGPQTRPSPFVSPCLCVSV
jgi:hypothetical protein